MRTKPYIENGPGLDEEGYSPEEPEENTDRKFLLGFVLALTLWFISSQIVFALRHPWLTDTERLLYIEEALMFVTVEKEVDPALINWNEYYYNIEAGITEDIYEA